MITEADATLRLHGTPAPAVEWPAAPTGAHLLACREVAGSPCRVVVAPSGVWVIEERRVQEPPAGGLLERRTGAIRLGPAEVAGVAAQRDAIRAAVPAGIPVHALLCVSDPDWPLVGGAYPVGDVQVLWPERAGELIAADAVLDPAVTARVRDELDAAFPA